MDSKNKILIVDDDQVMGEILGDILLCEGYAYHQVYNGPSAIEAIQTSAYDVILLDLLLPGLDGIGVLKKVLQTDPTVIVIMMSGHGSIQKAVEATRLGAYEWLEKPLKAERVLLTLRNAIEKNRLLQEREAIISMAKSQYRMIGVSSSLREIFQIIDKIAGKDITVLITGESGTGKELVANAIFLNSNRASAPLVQVNCAAIPETLIESELFGHVKGAFTGALEEKSGKFYLANNGTLFMDEIGSLSIYAQAKVLRAIETGEVAKIGTEKIEKVDLRLISATNQNLQKMVLDGTFREDLYHRINVIEIKIPPLRERTDDILPLASYFINIFCSQYNIKNKELLPSAEAILLSHPWSGNVRELRNVAEKITVLVDSPEVAGEQVQKVIHFPGLSFNVAENETFTQAKRNFEMIFLRNALSKNDWNVLKTAGRLKMSRSLLYKKMEIYNIELNSKNLDR